jgi:two-component system, NarL family, invasion response regulator UvrY
MTEHLSCVPARIRLLLVDDHPAVREGLALLVSSEGIDVSAEAAQGADALKCVDACRPDLAIVDLSLDRGEDGLVLVAELKARGIPALVYSMYTDPQHIEGAFVAGALGYVTKAEFRGVLVEAIREVGAGRRFVSPKAAAALAERLTGAPSGGDLDHLSAKEREVYRLLGEGEGTYEIASAMKISTHTVESYYGRIRLKLGLEGMYELRHHAIDHHRQRL